MEFSSSFLRLFSFLLISFSLPHSHGWHQFLPIQKGPRLDKHHINVFHSATSKRYKKTDLKFLPTHSVSFRTNHQQASNQELTNTACKNNDDKDCNPTPTTKFGRTALKRIVPILSIAVAAATLHPVPALATTIHATTTNIAVPIMTCPVSAATELRLIVRLLFAALIGAVLGKERSLTKHSAGVRTMSLVSMGAAVFTICGGYGFANFPKVDASRMAANVASGVGFIGAGVITTSVRNDDKQNRSNRPNNTVHGLATAATIWLSAAVGISCGVGLLGVATTAAFSTIFILRMGRKKKKASPSISYTTIQQRYQLLGKNEGNRNNMNPKGDHNAEIHSSRHRDESHHHEPDIVHSNLSSQKPEISEAQDKLLSEERAMEVKEDQVHSMKKNSSIDIDELSSETMEEIVRSALKNDKESVAALVDRVLKKAEESDRFTEYNSNSRKGNPSSSDSDYHP